MSAGLLTTDWLKDGDDWTVPETSPLREGWTVQNGELAPYPDDDTHDTDDPDDTPSHDGFASALSQDRIAWPGRTAPTLSRRKRRGDPPAGNSTNPHDDPDEPPY